MRDGKGGAYIIVDDIAIGPPLPPIVHVDRRPTSPAHHPYADIYPLFIAADVRRVDGVTFQAPITTGATFEQRPALQVSRRNNSTQHYPQTAVAKFVKVQHYLEELR